MINERLRQQYRRWRLEGFCYDLLKKGIKTEDAMYLTCATRRQTHGRAFARRFNVSLLREPHIALPIKDNELVYILNDPQRRRRTTEILSSYSSPIDLKRIAEKKNSLSVDDKEGSN